MFVLLDRLKLVFQGELVNRWIINSLAFKRCNQRQPFLLKLITIFEPDLLRFDIRFHSNSDLTFLEFVFFLLEIYFGLPFFFALV